MIHSLHESRLGDANHQGPKFSFNGLCYGPDTQQPERLETIA